MEGRNFLKSNWHLLDEFVSDQAKGVKHPPIQERLPEGTPVIALPDIGDTYSDVSLTQAMDARRSIRKFSTEPLKPEELSFLLRYTQKVGKVIRNGIATLRPVPSAGARHPFETYLLVNAVSGLDPGLYRYLPLDHSLALLGGRRSAEDVTAACNGQTFCGDCPVVFAWTTLPYRTEWRYGPASHKVIALDAGHLCQNLYLACAAAGLGTCAIGAYDQIAMDRLLGVDGKNEFLIYLAPVGIPARPLTPEGNK